MKVAYKVHLKVNIGKNVKSNVPCFLLFLEYKFLNLRAQVEDMQSLFDLVCFNLCASVREFFITLYKMPNIFFFVLRTNVFNK